jgi:hypothetical protein
MNMSISDTGKLEVSRIWKINQSNELRMPKSVNLSQIPVKSTFGYLIFSIDMKQAYNG